MLATSGEAGYINGSAAFEVDGIPLYYLAPLTLLTMGLNHSKNEHEERLVFKCVGMWVFCNPIPTFSNFVLQENTKRAKQQLPKQQKPEQQQQQPKPKSMYILDESDVDQILTVIGALNPGFVSRVYNRFQFADSSSSANRILASQSLSQDDKTLLGVQAEQLNLLPWTFALMVVEYYTKMKN